MTPASAPHAIVGPSQLKPPGAFQCAILRALELPKAHREVFLLKEIQGHNLWEIAAILGITIDTARARWKRGRRAIGHLGTTDGSRRAR